MTFDPQRAAALRTAIDRTVSWLTWPTDGDAKTLLTEHLALLHEAELLMLTDAQPEDESHIVKSEVVQTPSGISAIDRDAGRVNLQKTFDQPGGRQ